MDLRPSLLALRHLPSALKGLRFRLPGFRILPCSPLHPAPLRLRILLALSSPPALADGFGVVAVFHAEAAGAEEGSGFHDGAVPR